AEIFMEGIEEEAQDENQRFKVSDLDAANWALRKIAVYKKKQTEIKDLAETERYRIDSWEKGETESIDRSIAYFEGLLGQYLIEQRNKDPKFKISTPYGQVIMRKQQPKWEYEDKTVIEYLKSVGLNGLIRIKEELNKVDLKKTVTVEEGRAILQGVELPGVNIYDQPDRVIVEVE
ncbi:host-nuclease inhibitor Gam family protein, partial [Lutispora sp.]|uniref:host-nuclease inhibitor Gam family protein n=1 Tax=Lutispora sp. TaxID=2828727 RepID=UPI002B1FB31D